jgi:phosphoglycolate phosphatase-like HAD superfamily hydrolase
MPERTLSSHLRESESVHFDLDGVLLDSNELKVRCMIDAIAGLGPQVVAPFVDEFRVSFGRSRFEHFRRLYAHHLGGDELGWEDFYAIYGGAYGALVRARYGDAPLCAHAAALVRSLAAAGVPLTVVTGTPTAEAEAVLRTHGLDGAFQAILGGEQHKAVRVREALTLTGSSREGAVVIGDSLADLAAANQNRVRAVFVERYSLDPEVATLAIARGEQVAIVHDLDPAGVLRARASSVADLAAHREAACAGRPAVERRPARHVAGVAA